MHTSSVDCVEDMYNPLHEQHGGVKYINEQHVLAPQQNVHVVVHYLYRK